ncbi:hypothetical protein, partial [Coleofasciculus sp. H7-2]|uniref:hypothetical protein n=1 Tax=Coleofasciculus sp. H7-2 TaxID=3351545 RepID=UPI00366A6591
WICGFCSSSLSLLFSSGLNLMKRFGWFAIPYCYGFLAWEYLVISLAACAPRVGDSSTSQLNGSNSSTSFLTTAQSSSASQNIPPRSPVPGQDLYLVFARASSNFDGEYIVRINVVVPARFPNPSQELYASFGCNSGGVYELRGFDLPDTSESYTRSIWNEWVSIFDAQVTPNKFMAGDVEIFCEDDAIGVKAETIQDALRLIQRTSIGPNGLVEGDRALIGFTYEMFHVYPALRRECREWVVPVLLQDSLASVPDFRSYEISGECPGEPLTSVVYASQREIPFPQDVVLAARQNDETVPLLFNSQPQSFPFAPDRPLTLFFRKQPPSGTSGFPETGYWNKLIVRYDNGSFLWSYGEEGPQ